MFTGVLLTMGLFVLAHTSDDWHYHSGAAGGPENWKTLQKNCAGQGQSPVNIDTSQVHYNHDLFTNPFEFHGFDTTEGVKFRLGNNGHTVQIVVEGDDQHITGAGLPGRYNILQLHFHWGSHNGQGSEHAKDSEFYPMEIHWVHYYHIYNVSQALAAPDGLAVLGFFFKITEHDNEAFNPILIHFENVTYKNDEIYIPPVELRSLFPKSMDHFYRYKGSLTTPGCYESVFWTVFDTPIEISERQINKFRMLVEGGKPKPGETHTPPHLSDNFRPLQKMNDREIYTNMAWQDKNINTSGATCKAAFSWFLSILIISFVLNFRH